MADARARVIAVVGATATGKTEIAERIAEHLDGEVVCADSRQVFRELDIGTGGPTAAQRAARPHHLFDTRSIADPGAGASAGWYVRAARSTCAAIHARGRPAVLVGGTGLYLTAARRGLATPPPHDPAVRTRLREAMDALGPEVLYDRLRLGDPETASRLAPRDRQRIGRALEVLESSGRPLSWWHRQPHGPAVEGEWRVVEIRRAPSALAARIAARTSWMFANGLIEECRALLEAGLGDALRALRAVGYDESLDLLEGRATRAEAEARTTRRTSALARRQRTWFRHQMDAERIDADALDDGALTEAVLAAARA